MFRKILKLKKIVFLTIFTILVNCLCSYTGFASEVATLSDFKIYNASIIKTIEEVTSTQVYNLPTPFKQKVIHPLLTDNFGRGKDETPIFRVVLDSESDVGDNAISLTFDSAYINDYTFKILDILDEYDAKATFFMTKDFIEQNPSHIMAIIKRGHEIGNHSTTHPDFNKIDDVSVVKEVWQTHDFIRNLTGVEMCLFRFPFGSFSPRTVNLLKQLGYYPIQWAFDSIDWKNLGVDALINRFKNNIDKIEPGSIILFHNGATYTPEALPTILDMFKEKGYKFVKVSDLIYKDNFNLKFGVQEKKK